MPHDKDGHKVSMQEAFDAWEPHAAAMLTQTAKRYNGFVTYAQLAEFVQTESGVTHNGLIMNWIGYVLGRVIRVCNENSWPQLSAMCVTSDGTVGAGYRFALSAAERASSSKAEDEELLGLDDLDEHAARTRLECYRFFGAELPPDGGRPTLTPKAKAAKGVQEEAGQARCPARALPYLLSSVARYRAM